MKTVWVILRRKSCSQTVEQKLADCHTVEQKLYLLLGPLQFYSITGMAVQQFLLNSTRR